MTITTVGYGDRFPTTNWGRIIGIFVMIAGVGLFGTLSGFLANQFLTPPAPKTEAPAEVRRRRDPKARIAELKQMLEAQEKATADLRAKLEEIDHSYRPSQMTGLSYEAGEPAAAAPMGRS